MKPISRATAIGYSVVFALAFALMVFQPLAQDTYEKLFQEKGEILVQPAIEEGLPIPLSYVWNPTLKSVISFTGAFPLPPAIAWQGICLFVLIYIVLRILNPTFRLTTGIDWDRSLLTHTYMHTPPMLKAFLMLTAAFLPIMGFWFGFEKILGGSSVSILLRTGVIGAALFLILCRDGIAGDYETGVYEPVERKAPLKELALRGAIAGLYAGAALVLWPSKAPDKLFDFYLSLGSVSQSDWLSIAVTVCGTSAMLGAGLGLMIISTSAQGEAFRRLRMGAVLGVVLLIGVQQFWSRFSPSFLSTHYDYQPGNNTPIAERLIAKSGISNPLLHPQTTILLRGSSAVPLRFSGRSVSEIPAGQLEAQKVKQFLQSRDFRTAYSYPAYVTMLDAAALNWNAEEAIQVSILALKHSGNAAHVRLLLDKLRISAPTPAVLKEADEALNSGILIAQDRKTKVFFGDIFARMGAQEKAKAWYRKADLPPSQVTSRAAEISGDTFGVISGQLFVNGKPASNVNVGVVSREALSRLQPLTDANGITSPFALWWISASTRTGPDGRFRLERLYTGEYTFAFGLTTGFTLKPDAIVVKSAPQFNNSVAGSTDLGKIEIELPAEALK